MAKAEGVACIGGRRDVLIVIIVLIGLALFFGTRSRRCPACAEKVQRAASKCRYCGHSFPPSRDRCPLGLTIFGVVIGLVLVGKLIDGVFGTHIIALSDEQKRELAEEKRQEAAAEATTPSVPDKLKVMTLARRRLNASLRDPDSADIRNTFVPAGKGYMCGEVNATNGFGGKTGYRRFIAGAVSDMPLVIEGDSISAVEFDKLWTKAC